MILQKTMLSHAISATEQKSQYDEACKILLANKMILAWIMKSCLDEFRELDVREIAKHYIEGTPQISEIAVHRDEIVSPPQNAGAKASGRSSDTASSTGSLISASQTRQRKSHSSPEQISGLPTEDSSLSERTTIFDIRFYALNPVSEEQMKLIINVEAQNDFYPGYPLVKRSIYYCCRMISAQYGTEFADSNYEDIKKVYSIWVCTNPSAKRRNTVNCYSIAESQLIGDASEIPQNYDLLSAVIICLGNDDDSGDGILKLLEVLLSPERKAEEKKKILEEEFDIPMTKQMEMEVEYMCNLSDGVEARGIEKGIKQGIERGTLNTIKAFMDTFHLSAEEAISAANIAESDQYKYLSQLNELSSSVSSTTTATTTAF